MSKHEKFRYKSATDLKTNAEELAIELPWSDSIDPLFQPILIRNVVVPNRLTVQPMEGFDCDAMGTPGPLAFRRYGRYAAGGNGMIWFEACSVSPDGRSNPHQMMITSDNVHQYKRLTEHIRSTAQKSFGVDFKPYLVLQLTHSGRYSKPDKDFQPKFFSNNPILAGVANNNPDQFYTDSEIDEIKEAYIEGIKLAEQAGFDAVDIKACHGYLLHEMLYAYDRVDSRYGGSFENRTQFLREVLNTPSEITKAFRLSAFDLIPHPFGFGMNMDGSLDIELSEVKRLISEFSSIVPLWNISAGIPRYNAFVGRPFDRGVFNAPPPEEHPIIGINRLIDITSELQQEFPDLQFVGTGYSWLRQYFPNVGAGVLAQNKASFIGVGRSSFAYPDAPRDLMEKGYLDAKKVCVSCSKCTEFMRLGVPTGCAIRDEQYKKGGKSNKSLNPLDDSFSQNGRMARSYATGTLVIGSGAAALNAAICLWESGVKDIIIVTEKWGGGTSNNAGSDKQTYYKMSLDPSVADSAHEMAGDLSRGGAMHGDIALCESQISLQAFYNLVRLGVPFPHNQYGSYPGYKTDHDPRARATSAGPLTSQLMFKCLARQVKEYGIPVHDRVVMVELLYVKKQEGKSISGAIGLNVNELSKPDHGLVLYHANQVVLATGGPAGIYRDSVYPVSQTGSVGMALKIGAKAQNLSISQFGIASVKFRWNLSGSYQQVIPRYFSVDETGAEVDFLNEKFPDQETLWTAIFLKGYQWPFDQKKVNGYGSSLIDVLVQKESACGRKVYLDFTRNPSDFSVTRLQSLALDYLQKSGALADTPIERLKLLNQPAIDLYKSHGIDISFEPLEIAVCSQHNNGGLIGDIWWESNIKGLYPIGEVNGTHGITRPGGSALNSGQVGGIRAAMRISLQTSSPLSPRNDQEILFLEPFRKKIQILLAGNGLVDYRDVLSELQQRMSEHGGAVRDRKTIKVQVEKAWALWNKLNNEVLAVEPSKLVEALRTFDLCLTHVVYLEAIEEYLNKSEDEWFIKENILEIHLNENLTVEKKWVQVRPIPHEEMWFEKVWKEYRTLYDSKTGQEVQSE
jgi:succinate dehydrogenase/fumarate reductase flavoprotein subunit/2,4-dienoyl-CoA reductase-like NADH-dependent reductase (Old Yellow Enzyme family)